MRVDADVWALYPLNAQIRKAIHAFKYRAMTGIADELVCWSGLSEPGICGWAQLVWVPVPVTSSRLRERGYNQAEVLARSCRKRWGGALECGILRRHRFSGSQTRLDAHARALNVWGAFRTCLPCPAHVILVDDVLTTGATTSACCWALRRAGAKRVSVLTLAYDIPGNGRDDWNRDLDLFRVRGNAYAGHEKRSFPEIDL